jgi:hypothetical protein
MIRKTFTIFTTMTLLTTSAVSQSRPLPGPVKRESRVEHVERTLQNSVKLDITNLKPIGNKPAPHALEVSWNLTTNSNSVRIEGYEITVELNGNGANGRAFQTPSPNITKVAVGLLSIPNETRARLFSGPVTVTVRLKAKFIVNSLRFNAETQKTQTL